MSWRSVKGKPSVGWKSRAHPALMNPRPPAVPATLQLTLEEYFGAAGAIGLIAAQAEEPDLEWASEWALKFGRVMARKARARRKP